MVVYLIVERTFISRSQLESLQGHAQSSFFAQYGSDIVKTALSIVSGIILAIIAPAVFRKVASFTHWAARRIGPERSMARQYCNSLAFEVRQIKLLGMTSPRDLTEVFVPLRIRDPDTRMSPEQRASVYPSLIAALPSHSRITMLGDPGAGKTTVARHVALLAAEGKIKCDRRTLTPFYIPLNEMKQRFEPLGEKDRAAPEEILSATMKTYGFDGARNYVIRRLRAGRCLVIFDGFDELANDARQRIAADMIRQLVRNYNMANRIIVTSREAGFRSSQFNAFTTLVVEDLPPRQAHSYILKWFKEEPERGKDLIRILEKNPRLQSLASNPLMLAVICITYHARGDLPNRRADLYEYCIDTLNTLWDESRGVDRAPAFSGPMKLEVLKQVALELHAERKVEFTTREFRAKIRRYLPAADAKYYQEDDFVKEVIEHTGIVRGNGADTLAFQHLTFQEYLAARKLVDDGTHGLDYLAGVAGDPWWSETIVLAAGILRDASDLIGRIYQKSLPNLTNDMWLMLGKCFADADLTDLELKDEVLERIITFASMKPSQDKKITDKGKYQEVGNQTESLVDSRAIQDGAIQLIEELGRENIATYLERRIDEVTALEKRLRLVASYGLLGKEGSHAFLQRMATRTSEPIEMRAACLNSLAKIPGGQAVGPVRSALADPDPIIRMAGLGLAHTLPRWDNIRMLRIALDDNDEEIQAAAASMLVQIEATEAIDVIERYFNSHPRSPEAARARDFVSKARYEQRRPEWSHWTAEDNLDYPEQLYGEY